MYYEYAPDPYIRTDLQSLRPAAACSLCGEDLFLGQCCYRLSGALLCEQQRYADLNFGSGMLVVGLASVIIGQVFFGQRGITLGIISAVAGSLVYRIILQVAYRVDMPSYAVKLLSAVIVVVALSIPLLRKRFAERRAEREEAEP